MSETDLRRSQARVALQAKFDQMTVQGNRLIAAVQAYAVQDCQTMPDPDCAALGQRVEALACAIVTNLDEVGEIARRGHLPPGVWRAVPTEFGLDARNLGRASDVVAATSSSR